LRSSPLDREAVSAQRMPVTGKIFDILSPRTLSRKVDADHLNRSVNVPAPRTPFARHDD